MLKTGIPNAAKQRAWHTGTKNECALYKYTGPYSDLAGPRHTISPPPPYPIDNILLFYIEISRPSTLSLQIDVAGPRKIVQKTGLSTGLSIQPRFSERHTTSRKCPDYGVHGQFDRSSLLWEMTVGVGGVCSLTSEVLASLNKGMPPPAYFGWRGWFRAGLPLFRRDMTFEM
ncbi:hypothetical protein J6590_058490 [Homalodisca vitripennis]|nr:hypothetical protein J6590_058490 [Homalodisca vitripennis]